MGFVWFEFDGHFRVLILISVCPASCLGRFDRSILFVVSEDHPLVVHRESITPDCAGGGARPLPLHGQF